jgi:xanthine dehydrogenase accessory factor
MMGNALTVQRGWADTARGLLDAGPVALVTILATEGSTPLGAGARMVVVTDGLAAGSVGGGALEATTIAQAQAMLDQAPGTWRVQDYPLGPLLGQCCGGRVRVLVERLDPAQCGWLGDVAPGCCVAARLEEDGVMREVVTQMQAPAPASARGDRPGVGDSFAEPLEGAARSVLVFGAGHVGLALAGVMAPLPFAMQWYDNRPEFARPGVCFADEPALVAAIGAAPRTAAVLIMTHDHGLDYRLTRAAMARDVALIGVIGSATKRARFVSRLEKDGVADARARLVCPIGVAGIAGKAPAVIAIAVAAQLLMLEKM